MTEWRLFKCKYCKQILKLPKDTPEPIVKGIVSDYNTHYGCINREAMKDGTYKRHKFEEVFEVNDEEREKKTIMS